MMRQATQAEIDAGQKVQDAQGIVDKYQGNMDTNNDMVTNMTATKAGYISELDLLDARAEKGELPYNLQLRQIDLHKDIKTVEQNISNMIDAQAEISHQIETANLGLKTAKDAYVQVVAPPSVTGQLSSADIDYLKSCKPRSMQSHTEKKELVDKYGMNAVNEHVPMI